jgi:hypothetical protein
LRGGGELTQALAFCVLLAARSRSRDSGIYFRIDVCTPSSPQQQESKRNPAV